MATNREGESLRDRRIEGTAEPCQAEGHRDGVHMSPGGPGRTALPKAIFNTRVLLDSSS
jgi:hypothetical protein